MAGESFEKAIPGRMTKFKISELSGVDRPAQGGARAVIMKREDPMAEEYETYLKRKFTHQRRKDLAERGFAEPDGSYPIENEEDLHNAIRAFGRSKDKVKTKAHIISRAKAMGMSSALPDGWVSKADSGQQEVQMDKALLKALGLAEDATPEQVAKAAAEALEKANTAEATAKAATAAAEKAARKASMTDDERDYCSKMSDGDADDFMQKPKAERDKAMAEAKKNDESFVSKGVTIRKSEVGPAVFQVLKAQAEQLSAQEVTIAKAQEEAAMATFEKRAGDELSHTSGTIQERALILKGISEIKDETARKAALDGVHAANAALKSAFSRIGKGAGGETSGSAANTLDNLAKDYMKNNPKTTFAKAYDTVCQERPDLYEKAEAERRERAAAAH